MHVVQTDGEPPNQGNTNRAMSGCTKNKRYALKNVVEANQIIRARFLFETTRRFPITGRSRFDLYENSSIADP